MKIWAFLNPGNGKPGRKFLAFSILFCALAFTFTEAQTISPGTGMMVGSGAVVNSNTDVTMSGGGTLDVQGTLILKKNLVNLNSSPSTLGTGLIELSGTSAQTVSGQNIIQDLRINNAAGVSISGDTRVNGILKLKSGIVSLGANNLLLGPSASDSGGSASAMVDVTGTGEFRKEFSTTPSFPKTFTFPVGDNTGTAEYSPVAANFTSGAFASGNYLGVTLRNLPDPDANIASGDYLSRYWLMNSNAITGTVSCGLAFTFTDADVTGTKGNLFLVNSTPTLQTFDGVSGNQLTGTVGSFSRFTGADGALQTSFKAFLQGPYNATDHHMIDSLVVKLPLGDRSMLTNFPSNQPYNGSPWNYTGTESVVSLPAGVVDWVLVELRQASKDTNATAATLVTRRAGFLKQDGSITDLDGTPLKFYHTHLSQNLYPVIRHRNHMAIMAHNAVTKDGTGIYSYDYSSGSGQVWGGTAGMKQVDTSPVRWAMVGSDANADNNIWINDYANYYVPEFFISGQYMPADFNLDGNVWINDYANYYVPNFFISNQLP